MHLASFSLRGLGKALCLGAVLLPSLSAAVDLQPSQVYQGMQPSMVNPINPQLQQLTPEACAGCHREIYDQWKGSMHANSSALKDPIHAAMYKSVIGDPTEEGVRTKKGKYPICLKCHAPMAALDGKTKLDALPRYNAGVTCVTCHSFKALKGVHTGDGKLRLGVDAYEFANQLQGPSGRDLGPMAAMPVPTMPQPPAIAVPPDRRDRQAAIDNPPMGQGPQGGFHPYPLEGNAQVMRSSDACMGCHDQRNNSHGVPLCMTGAEFKDAGAYNCQQCHMPVNNGFADHSMAGGHVQAMVERAVVMTMAAETDGDDVVAKVTLKNTLPHNAPTGAPFRNLYVEVTGLNAVGATVWRNYQKHPMMEDPKSIMMLRLLDDEDKPAPPPKAKKLGPDSRLKPHEERTLEYRIPKQGVAAVRAQLHYDLLLPPQKKMQGIPDELKQSKVVAFAEERI
ncbi:MAG: cytochrome c family protein [Chromatiales bacterium]|nr:cytochrome c family protein [Chromatiales bacterium]